MKKVILFFICAIALMACTQQHKAETTVKSYVKAHLHDAGSYEPAGFDKLRPHSLDANEDVANSDTDQLKTVPKKQDGWLLGHAYMIKTSSGAPVRTYKRFILNMNCDSVMNAY
jgi:hypothetical protein